MTVAHRSPVEAGHDPAAEAYGDLGQFLPYLLNRVMGRMNQMLAQRLRLLWISFQEWRVLLVLVNKGPRNIKRLSEDTIIAHSTLSRMIDRMARADLVTRGASPGDARNVTLTATDRGRDLFRQIRHHGLAILDQAADGLSEAELATVLRAARRMADNLGLDE
ncbi:MAG: MarR family transcriptional regulator [Phycisphaerales bacterium]